ncbi:MAG: type II toxin-antitoxin system RelE/ParE family toxin [Calditrichaeota bacterium]|jgi:toxin ParE1/3/4|nr:type II toxin-antitoxin system RelE/ParE family toxin [Deltaproteobacteria bacterium]MBT4268091.1 type II toxin-antitoxin system RelE/ParE family toxin [Deltaproteobacteria bacterium]MBT4640109.1 type II toxin-antitoxin system RelE/ParE family toxin [Deltaproteobacteria bacterium]MBT7617711.1 type II toxin-antitoxin system RelE/ParE family toxin [Calditrichota bacterium]
MKIIWSPLAQHKLTDIADYIAQDKPGAALKWVETVLDQVENLSSFPNSGRAVPELDNEQYKELIIGNYRVIYKITEKQIQILTIRNFKQLLSSEDLSS